MRLRLRVLMGLAGVLGVVAGLPGCATPEREVQVDVTSSADYGTNMVRCLTARGWEVVRTEDGGFETPNGIPTAQSEFFQADTEACLAENGYGEFVVTEELASSFYDKQVALGECLRGLGYPISQPPSRESFVDALVAGEPPSWFPYHEVTDMTGGSPDAMHQAEESCPRPTSW